MARMRRHIDMNTKMLDKGDNMENDIKELWRIIDETYQRIQHHYDVNTIFQSIEDRREDALVDEDTETADKYNEILNDRKKLDAIANRFRYNYDNWRNYDELWIMVDEAIDASIKPKAENDAA